MKDLPARVAIDTGALVALVVQDEPAHKSCLDVLRRMPARTQFFTTEACLAEVSFLLPQRHEFRQQLLCLLRTLQVNILSLDLKSLERVYELQNKYSDLPMDFADATIIGACERMDTRHVFTLDRKDFSIYRPSHCQRLSILP